MTFTRPVVEATSVQLAGVLSNWKPFEMCRRKGCDWQTVVELDPGQAFKFKHFVGEHERVSDAAAERYAPNPFGGDNSVALTGLARARRLRRDAGALDAGTRLGSY